MKRILVTGALGQIGSELTAALRERFGADDVVATDVASAASGTLATSGPFEQLDVTAADAVARAFRRHEIDTVYHLAALLSATGERKPDRCWEVNVDGTRNVLDAAVQHGVSRVLIPSSIAVFGPETPRDDTPQETVIRPRTMYGITKVVGELLGEYVSRTTKLDVRGLRYPGIISSETQPGGGTTDYAVEIFYEAVRHDRYTAFVREDVRLPMMYMPDAVRAIMELAEADRASLRHPTSYNLTAMSFSVGELAAEIRKHRPGFTCAYEPDFRQAIAESWPRTIDDSAARRDWGWRPRYTLADMTRDMLERLEARLAAGTL